MQKINFQNLPSTATPINATNLNAIQSNAESAINDVADDLSDAIDLFNDTSGNDWQTMMKNKIDWCITNLNTTKQKTMSFVNGGWSGVNYGCGVFSIIDGVYQLIWVCSDFIAYCRKSGTDYEYKRTDNIFGTELFSGSSNGVDIPLNANINNYTYIDIVAGTSYGGIITTRFLTQSTLTVCLTTTEIDTSDSNNWGLITPSCKYTLDGTYLRYNGATRVYKYESGGWTQDRNNPIYVYKVIGYR